MSRIIERIFRRDSESDDNPYTQEGLVDWLPKKWREKIKRDRELRELTKTYLDYWRKECKKLAESISEEILGSRSSMEALGRGYVIHGDNTVITLTSAFDQALAGYLEVSDLLVPDKTPRDPKEGRHTFPGKALATEKVEGYEHISDQAVGSANAIGNCSALYLDRQRAKKTASKLNIDLSFDSEEKLWELFVDSQHPKGEVNLDEAFALLEPMMAKNKLRLLEGLKEFSFVVAIHIAENHKRDLHNATRRQDRDSGSAGVVLTPYEADEALKQVEKSTQQLFSDSKKAPWKREYLHIIQN